MYGSGRRSALALLTPLPMARGFVYLAAVVDWFSRRVLAWRLSITLEAAFCIEALEEALAHYDRPEIFNWSCSAFVESGLVAIRPAFRTEPD